eukprot:4130359-Karenia_brevis.AAC.1
MFTGARPLYSCKSFGARCTPYQLGVIKAIKRCPSYSMMSMWTGESDWSIKRCRITGNIKVKMINEQSGKSTQLLSTLEGCVTKKLMIVYDKTMIAQCCSLVECESLSKADNCHIQSRNDDDDDDDAADDDADDYDDIIMMVMMMWMTTVTVMMT